MRKLPLLLAFTLMLGVQANAQVEENEDWLYDEPQSEEILEGDAALDDGAIIIDEPASDVSAGQIEAAQPTVRAEGPDVIRLIPMAGSASMDRQNNPDLDNLEDGFSTGLLVDIGQAYWALETGVTYTTTEVFSPVAGAQTDVDFWGLPLLAKVNFSGNPQSTIYAKAGVSVITADSDTANTFDEVDLLGQAGLGAAIPLGFQELSLVIDGTYNELFTREGINTNYSGYQLMAGLSFEF